MSKAVAISVSLSVAFVVGLSWKELVVHAGGGGGTPAGNGDVNGDGEYDVSDAVYFLSWRFQGGRACRHRGRGGGEGASRHGAVSLLRIRGGVGPGPVR